MIADDSLPLACIDSRGVDGGRLCRLLAGLRNIDLLDCRDVRLLNHGRGFLRPGHFAGAAIAASSAFLAQMISAGVLCANRADLS